VDFLTAAGVGELVALHTRLRDLGGQLVLDHVGERAFEVLRVAGLTGVLTVRRRVRREPAGGQGPGETASGRNESRK
jgi:hypothetical protein